jgi:hypothetical protein
MSAMFLSLSSYLLLSSSPRNTGLEGVLIATRDVTFHSLTYLFTGSALLLYQNAVRTRGFGLMGVWKGIAAFSWVRLSIFAIRVRAILAEKKKEGSAQ